MTIKSGDKLIHELKVLALLKKDKTAKCNVS